MTALTMDSFVAATKREMQTPRGTRTILSVLKQGGTPEGAVAMCAANATKVATAERLEEIVAGVLGDDRMTGLVRYMRPHYPAMPNGEFDFGDPHDELAIPEKATRRF